MEINFCLTSLISEEEMAYYRTIVSAETLARTEKLRLERDRLATIVGEGLVRVRLGDGLGLPPESIEIFRTPGGKPYIREGLHFNISHCGEAVAIAVSSVPVGVDIEALRQPPYTVMRRFCREGEAEYINSSRDEAESIKRFFEIWTLKEAYLKCTGEGLSGGLKTVEFTKRDGLFFCSDERFKCASTTENEGYILSYVTKNGKAT